MFTDGNVTTIEEVGSRLVLRVPIGTDVTVGTTSGRVSVRGDVGATAITSVSGRVEVAAARSADVRTTSGRVTIGHVAGECRIRSQSGTVAVSTCESVDAATTSGRISLRGVRGPVRAHCVSGRVQVEMAIGADVEAETVTGQIQVSFPAGVRIGRVDQTAISSGSQDVDALVAVRSATGQIDVVNR